MASQQQQHLLVQQQQAQAQAQQQQQQQQAAGETQLLTLKVMRLSKPGFAEQSPRLFEADDLLAQRPAPVKTYTLPSEGGAAPGSGPASAAAPASHGKLRDVMHPLPPPIEADAGLHDPHEAQFALSDMFKLPANFGTIYLGETFSSYICVNNEAMVNVRDVSVKAELQTTSQRFVLADSSEKPRPEMHPADLIDVVVTHEIKELGVHILVCSVFYTTNLNEKKYFRKFFRFQVGNPLTVKTKVLNVRGNVFLEAQIQNITPRMMFLESVRFEPSALFILSDINNIAPPANVAAGMKSASERRKDIAGTFLAPQDLRQYLYKLTPVEASRAEAKLATSIGKLDIVWKTTLGERGRLQTSQLPRKLPVLDPIEISVASVPDHVAAEKQFGVAVEVRNCSPQPMRLTLTFAKNKLHSLWPIGLTSVAIGDLVPGGSSVVNLNMIALGPGLLTLGGFVLRDANTGRDTELDHIGDILVHRD